jgi:hypothetical protein
MAMDSLKFYPGLPYPTLLWLFHGVARLQGGQPAAVFYPLGHPTLDAYGERESGGRGGVKREGQGVWMELLVKEKKYAIASKQSRELRFDRGWKEVGDGGTGREETGEGPHLVFWAIEF